MGKKDIFYDLRQVTNLLWQLPATWRKLNLSRTCFNSSEGQESCDSLAKNNFVRATSLNRKGMTFACSSLHFSAAVGVLYNCLCLPSPCWSYWVSVSVNYTHMLLQATKFHIAGSTTSMAQKDSVTWWKNKRNLKGNTIIKNLCYLLHHTAGNSVCL